MLWNFYKSALYSLIISSTTNFYTDTEHAVTDVTAGNHRQYSIEEDLKHNNDFADNRLTSANWWPRCSLLYLCIRP